MPKKPLKIRYFDVWGSREEKYKFLETHDVKNTDWQEIEPKEPRYWFIPKDIKGEEIYKTLISIEDIFNISSSGVKTHRDDFILDDSKQNLARRLQMFNNRQLDDQFIRSAFGLKDTKTWKLTEARLKLIKAGIKDDFFKQYSYRPFDSRWIYFDKNLIDRARISDIWNLSEENLALISTKQLSTPPFRHSFVSQLAPDICLISLQTKESSYVFPLYVYKTAGTKLVFRSQAHLDLAGVQKQLDEFSENKKSNIKTEIINKLSGLINKTVSPEEIFYYIYAILYSNIYRKKYNEFLKIDFPRIPFTKDSTLFNKLAKLGEELVNLHLLKSGKLESITAKFPVTGENRVKFRKYNEKESRIYINENQYFEDIRPEIWNYYIGGYQILDKWLKDRIDKVLSPEDVNHFLKVITALNRTIELQKEIDKLYPEIEKGLI